MSWCGLWAAPWRTGGTRSWWWTHPCCAWSSCGSCWRWGRWVSGVCLSLDGMMRVPSHGVRSEGGGWGRCCSAAGACWSGGREDKWNPSLCPTPCPFRNYNKVNTPSLCLSLPARQSQLPCAACQTTASAFPTHLPLWCIHMCSSTLPAKPPQYRHQRAAVLIRKTVVSVFLQFSMSSLPTIPRTARQLQLPGAAAAGDRPRGVRLTRPQRARAQPGGAEGHGGAVRGGAAAVRTGTAGGAVRVVG